MERILIRLDLLPSLRSIPWVPHRQYPSTKLFQWYPDCDQGYPSTFSVEESTYNVTYFSDSIFDTETLVLITWTYSCTELSIPFTFFLQIWQGAGWWNRNVPPGSSTDRYPAGSDVHLGFLGASCWSLLWRQWRQGLDDPYGWHPWPFWIGTKVFTTVHHRRTILSRPTLMCKCYGLWVWNVIFDFE